MYELVTLVITDVEIPDQVPDLLEVIEAHGCASREPMEHIICRPNGSLWLHVLGVVDAEHLEALADDINQIAGVECWHLKSKELAHA